MNDAHFLEFYNDKRFSTVRKLRKCTLINFWQNFVKVTLLLEKLLKFTPPENWNSSNQLFSDFFSKSVTFTKFCQKRVRANIRDFHTVTSRPGQKWFHVKSEWHIAQYGNFGILSPFQIFFLVKPSFCVTSQCGKVHYNTIKRRSYPLIQTKLCICFILTEIFLIFAQNMYVIVKELQFPHWTL